MTDSQTALDSLEQHAARLQAHLKDLLALRDECSGVSLWLPACDADYFRLDWSIGWTRSRLARCQVMIAEERRKAVAA